MITFKNILSIMNIFISNNNTNSNEYKGIEYFIFMVITLTFNIVTNLYNFIDDNKLISIDLLFDFSIVEFIFQFGFTTFIFKE